VAAGIIISSLAPALERNNPFLGRFENDQHRRELGLLNGVSTGQDAKKSWILLVTEGEALNDAIPRECPDCPDTDHTPYLSTTEGVVTAFQISTFPFFAPHTNAM